MPFKLIAKTNICTGTKKLGLAQNINQFSKLHAQVALKHMIQVP